MELRGQTNIRGEENHISDEKRNMDGALDVSPVQGCRSVLTTCSCTNAPYKHLPLQEGRDLSISKTIHHPLMLILYLKTQR